MKWLDSAINRLDSLELEADLSRRRFLTALAVNLVTGVILFGVGCVLRLTLGPTPVAAAALIGFGITYGVAGYLIYRYIKRRAQPAAGAPPPT